MKILIIGCGRLGSKLARILHREGHTVSVVAENKASLELLGSDFEGTVVVGMPLELEVLKDAGVENCDAVAVVMADDNLNITVSQLIKEYFYIDNVVARINDPTREKVFFSLGLKTICSTNLACGAFASALVQSFNETQINFGLHTLGVTTRDIDSRTVGKSLSDVPIKSYEIVIGVLNTQGKLSLYSTKNDIILNSGDKIVYGRVLD